LNVVDELLEFLGGLGGSWLLVLGTSSEACGCSWGLDLLSLVAWCDTHAGLPGKLGSFLPFGQNLLYLLCEAIQLLALID
jgi:hypothetical protein